VEKDDFTVLFCGRERKPLEIMTVSFVFGEEAGKTPTTVRKKVPPFY